jgi:hypothetical protein
MTLHRRGVSRDGLLAALAEQLERDYREALWPALTASGSALERLESALASLCDVVDANLGLLEALGHAERDVVFHEQRRPALTKQVFTEPVQRLLAERPQVVGLAVPGMPVGSPGMEVPGRPAEPFEVIAFAADGSRRVFG